MGGRGMINGLCYFWSVIDEPSPGAVHGLEMGLRPWNHVIGAADKHGYVAQPSLLKAYVIDWQICLHYRHS